MELKYYIDVLKTLEIVAKYIELDADLEGELYIELMDNAVSFAAEESKK